LREWFDALEAAVEKSPDDKYDDHLYDLDRIVVSAINTANDAFNAMRALCEMESSHGDGHGGDGHGDGHGSGHGYGHGDLEGEYDRYDSKNIVRSRSTTTGESDYRSPRDQEARLRQPSHRKNFSQGTGVPLLPPVYTSQTHSHQSPQHTAIHTYLLANDEVLMPVVDSFSRFSHEMVLLKHRSDALNKIFTIKHNNQSKETLYLLTCLTFLMCPLQLSTGIYGMNFKYMPEIDFRYSYLIFWMVAGTWITICLTWFLRRKRYI